MLVTVVMYEPRARAASLRDAALPTATWAGARKRDTAKRGAKKMPLRMVDASLNWPSDARPVRTLMVFARVFNCSVVADAPSFSASSTNFPNLSSLSMVTYARSLALTSLP